MQPGLKERTLRVIGHQKWLLGRDRILRLFSNPDRQPSIPFETDFFGLTYTGNLNNFIDWWVFYYGAFALSELTLLSDLAAGLRARGKSVQFYDVGANIGHHTLYMSQHADRLFAFEPFSVVREKMAIKLERAGVKHAAIFPVALGDRTESATYTPPTGANQGTGTLGTVLPDNASATTLTVDVARGDDFFAANHLPPISLLKMDVEGFEVRVLEGLKETLWRDRPPILMEIQYDSSSEHGLQVKDLLYPNHLIFDVSSSKLQKYVLRPFEPGKTNEALVLPRELAGIIPGTELR